MYNTGIFDLLVDSREFRWLKSGQRPAADPPVRLLHGFTPAHKVLLLATLFRSGWPAGRRSMLVVAAGAHQAERLRDDLAAVLPGEPVLLFPARETWPHEELPVPKDVAAARLAVLERLAQGERVLVVAPVQAAVERLAPRAVFASLIRTVAVGQQVRPEELAAHLAQVGYAPVDLVEAPGQFLVPGGLIDVFPPTA
ncbi:MAG: hypothetical protein DIU82_07770, partial [Bacillota bacterium]